MNYMQKTKQQLEELSIKGDTRAGEELERRRLKRAAAVEERKKALSNSLAPGAMDDSNGENIQSNIDALKELQVGLAELKNEVDALSDRVDSLFLRLSDIEAMLARFNHPQN